MRGQTLTYTLIIGIILIGSSSFAEYETVNSKPQFSINDSHFSFYWSVWRSLSERETTRLKEGGHLLSNRQIRWQMKVCTSNYVLQENSENFWYWDKINYDSQGRIIPIREAQRPGYLYLNLITLHSMHLRGLGAFVPPKRNAGEDLQDYINRKTAAYDIWFEKVSLKGTRGFIRTESTHRLYDHSLTISQGAFRRIPDYAKSLSPEFDLYAAFAPTRWPIFYDERSHKPHSIHEPESWMNTSSRVSENTFRLQLEWDWCDQSKNPIAHVSVFRGELPPPGPNRLGRADSGDVEIPINEVDHF